MFNVHIQSVSFIKLTISIFTRNVLMLSNVLCDTSLTMFKCIVIIITHAIISIKTSRHVSWGWSHVPWPLGSLFCWLSFVLSFVFRDLGNQRSQTVQFLVFFILEEIPVDQCCSFDVFSGSWIWLECSSFDVYHLIL